LILAGQSGNRFFIHYEQGGFASFYAIDVFELRGQAAIGLSSNYCDQPASSLESLRSQIGNGGCAMKKP